MLTKINSNDFDSLRNALVGKFGWSEKDPERKFYLQNVLIGTVSVETFIDNNGNKVHWLVPWRKSND